MKEASCVPLSTPLSGEEWMDGKWHVWARDGGYFVYRVREGTAGVGEFYPKQIELVADWIVVDLGHAVTMCDVLNGRDHVDG